MTELSPVAKAVLDAAYAGNAEGDVMAAAAGVYVMALCLGGTWWR